jgi:ethanolamine ammonia-lyase large subunit
MDALMTLLANAGLSFLMGVPGADDVMLNYQSTSFHDALVLRELLGCRPSPRRQPTCRWCWATACRRWP